MDLQAARLTQVTAQLEELEKISEVLIMDKGVFEEQLHSILRPPELRRIEPEEIVPNLVGLAERISKTTRKLYALHSDFESIFVRLEI